MAVITDLVVKRIREKIKFDGIADEMVRKVWRRDHIGWVTHGKPLTTDTNLNWKEELLDELYDALQYAEGLGNDEVSALVLLIITLVETIPPSPHLKS